MATILIIDDSEADRLLCHYALKDFDSSTNLVIAASAEAGLALLADAGRDSERPDLILLDYNLPGMDGVSFMKRLSAHSDTPIPIIMLTGQGDIEVAVEAIKNGVDDYMVKDIEGRYLRELPGTVERVMAAHAQRRQIRQLSREADKQLLRNQILMQNSMDGIHVLDIQGNLMEFNEAFCNMLGYTPEEVACLNVADWDARWTAEEVREHVTQIKNHCERFETVHRRKDGSLIDVEISASAVEIEGKYYVFAAGRDITERKRFEKTLRLTQFALDNVSMTVAMMRVADGRFIYVNDAACKSFGHSRDELLGMTMFDVDPEFSPARWAELNRELKKGGTGPIETTHRAKDGRLFPVEVTASVLEIGGEEYHCGFARDITERKQAETTLQKSEASLRATLDNLPYLTWLKDTESRYITINKVFSDYLRLANPQEAIGKTDLDLQPRELAEKYRADDVEVMASRQRKHVEESSFDGKRTHWVETFKTPIIDSGGALLGTVGFARDITASKQAENSLREAAERLQSHINNSPMAVVGWGNDFHVTQWAGEAEKMFGWSAAETLGRPIMDLHLIYEEDVPIVQQTMAKLTSGARYVISSNRNVTKDGRVIHCVWYNSVLFDATGAMASVMSLVLDVTRQKQSEADLMAAKGEAEKANNAKSHFLAAASHDLRQPLTALNMYVGTLGRKLPESDHKLLANMKHCVTNLSEMLSGLLDLSKLDAGVVTTHVSHFLFEEMLAKIVSSYAPEAKAKGLTLRHRCSGLIGYTDSMLFQRIVGNLVSNAIRYTERGGVLIGCRRRQGKMFVEVWDTGIGIPADKTDEIFVEFRQLGNKERNPVKGSGLGLAIVAKSAALLGLQVRVNSRPGKGSVFAVELPLGKVVRPFTEPHYTHRPLRIALVEDNAGVAAALDFALTSFGHQLAWAPTSAELLAILDNVAPDIVISDYRLAGEETGFDAIESLRRRFGSGLPGIIITGDTDPTVMRMATRDITIQYKPLDLEALREKIAELTAFAR